MTTPPEGSSFYTNDLSDAIPGATPNNLATNLPGLYSNSNQTRSPKAMPSAVPPRRSSYGAVTALNGFTSVPQSALPETEWMSQTKKPRRNSLLPTSPESAETDGDEECVLTSGTTWSKDKETILIGPYEYMHGLPGKDFRAQLVAAFNVWLKVPEESLKIITEVVGMLHTSSLLVDDVEDNSVLRRGVPVAHSIFGTAQTINSANYVYFLALQEIFKLNNPKAIAIYTDELLNLHRGQGMDLFWRDTLTCPSEDDYLEMVSNKTGGLFRLAIKLMQAESTTNVDCTPLVNTVGMLYQILDDYRNLSDDTYTANKGMCEDLTEGKFSFPVIHSIHTAPENRILINILKQKTRDEDVKRYAVAYMEKTGSFAYTRKVLRGLTKRALTQIDELEKDRSNGNLIRAILAKLQVKDSRDQAQPTN
ncbi:hypothetical protein MBLNU457_g1121t1 [Dothideomycetes sp. NU457]